MFKTVKEDFIKYFGKETISGDGYSQYVNDLECLSDILGRPFRKKV